MSQTALIARYKQLILGHLRHPLKLRFLLCVTIVAGWYFLFYSPLSKQMAATTSGISGERKKLGTAREFEQLKKELAPYQKRIPKEADANDLMHHVIDHIRTSPMKLLDLKPEKPKDLGPYEAFGFRLTLEGRFAEIYEFLKWVETDERLLRIDSFKLDPAIQQPGRLTAQLVLLSLAEKPAGAAKTKPESGKHP